MNPRSPRLHLLDLVERIGLVLRAERRQAASGLQPVHLQILDFLRRANRYSDTPAAVAEYLGTTKGTVSQSLHVLESQGFLRRRPDRSDRRIVHLDLTARARPLLRDSKVFAADASDADVAAAVRVLEGTLLALQTARGGTAFGICRTCTHFRREPAARFRCGLTGEPLSADDSEKICREHQPAA